MLILGYISSFIMGTMLGLIGAGGSILTVPILFYFFGQDAIFATTNSLFVVGIAALAGAIFQIKKGDTNLKIGMYFAAPSFIGIYIARNLLLPSIPNILISNFGVTLTKPLFIMIIFSIIMVFSSWTMIRSSSSIPAETETTKLNTIQTNFLSIGIKGLMVGMITGFVGAGGGFLIIPALVILLKFPIRKAVGTSLIIISANSLFGFGISFRSVQTENCPLLLTICGLGIAGMYLGQKLSHKISERSLKVGFGYFALVIACLILWDQGLKL
ncbi:sulfite exporter TauE/SafE family protein [Leptospira selangorensis]|uniref:Probable membrane transporter protein n=1 Tax=Leptospira selangorensis TaxID=2484982 RepID=A0A5F2C2B1_9LEPT|nr:sulfite exporter TauE/SafE family protein [Leptospira selangorensis]TGM12990.1 sulfite exporter TauE/SafE family protein [Leptospira selangorensis]TGM21258.1 sulfite exporter TauE/SafE family protein [Leptospira selangorensis]